MLRHRQPLLERYGGEGGEGGFGQALRAALTGLIGNSPCPPPPGTAMALLGLMQAISVPRDMPLHAARLLRQALEATARLDPLDHGAAPPPLPINHRFDQNPFPFLTASSEISA